MNLIGGFMKMVIYPFSYPNRSQPYYQYSYPYPASYYGTYPPGYWHIGGQMAGMYADGHLGSGQGTGYNVGGHLGGEHGLGVYSGSQLGGGQGIGVYAGGDVGCQHSLVVQ